MDFTEDEVLSEVQDVDNDDDGIDADDDQIKDTAEDQVFDEHLTRDVEQGTAMACDADDVGSYGDEEKDNDDSGISESDVLDVEERMVEQSQMVAQMYACVGRGRYGKKAVDENDQPLPAGRIVKVEPEKGTYSEGLKMAKLPESYYRRLDGQEVQAQGRAARLSTPLIDFRAAFKHISIIVDQDDAEDKGYQHACRRLREILPDMKIDSLKSKYDIWSFGLHIHPITLEKAHSCSLLELLPEKIDRDENRPFWFLFKRPPTFHDIRVIKYLKDPDPRKGVFIIIDRTIRADLSCGALTSMNRFCVHEDHTYRKRSRWSLRIHDDFFEIQTVEAGKVSSNYLLNLTSVKYKVPLDIIDRTAVFYLCNNGFSLFVNMKGNIHELRRRYVSRKEEKTDEDDQFEPFKRQGIGKGKPKPLFSTIRLRFQLKSDEEIIYILDQQGEASTATSSGDQDQFIQRARKDSLQQIRETFKHLLDFFYKNRIHVCFGPVYQKRASLPQLSTLNSHQFPTFIQSYSWAMLSNIGFRLQMQLYLSKTFINDLHEYSKSRYSEETPAQIDDRFYRLCLYLHRRSSEYFFLDLDQEIENGIEIYDRKYRRTKYRNNPMLTFDESSSSTAYIPSVVLTPTTIKIRPLKLCKLNRVLREQRFGGVLNFALVELRDEAQRLLFPTEFRSLKEQILGYLSKGFPLTPSRTYKYLHHSQSQVKCKQFWFYYHDQAKGHLSHEDAYTWMGNFDKERVVAKHAARIALCFTSTDATIQIPAEKVTYVRDVKDAKKQYTFTDGVGTISSELRDQIQTFLKKNYAFSVLQIRYGGCKGTFSVDPTLDGQEHQLVIRDSMNKFTCDHDILELCKLSAPRALYLNRQDIVLMESREIPDTNFLHLQNKNQFWLIQALLSSAIAFELLEEKLLPVFPLRKIAQNLNMIEEQFFIKLIITCAFNIIRELIDRTRIRVSHKKARNMFGVVDEYGVLECGEVFVQYSLMRENKLNISTEQEEKNMNRCEVLTGNVVITKNPCHHPGDLRVFKAVYHPKLSHLKDVVVFPQKGDRPHPNEISGSDLDGDEYVVIWHKDLIPKTENEEPYAYDSQEDPPKMTRPITRDDINQIVMEVSEQDCLGSLTNIHLAYVDREGIKSKICTDLAGHISQEVDAAKTGKHPLSEKQIIELRKGLENQWPDFMRSRGKKEYYPSKRILGKLYRSARRAVTGWSRAISNHGNPHHIHLALVLTTGTQLTDQDNDEPSSKANTLLYYEQPLDPYISHPNWEQYLTEIKSLYREYRHELLEIINLYRFQDEIDLLCRSESMDASAGGSKKGGLEDSAAIEVTNLVQRIIRDFYHEFDERCRRYRCCKMIEKTIRNRPVMKRIDCSRCAEDKLAKAACAYKYSYEQSNRLPLKSNRRILSFPWLFSTQILRLRARNNPQDLTHQTDTIVGPACKLYLQNFTPKFKVLIPLNSLTDSTLEFCYEKRGETQKSLGVFNKKADEKISFVPLLRACFIEILNDWLTKQKIFGNTCVETDPKPLVPESIWHELMVNFLSYEYQPNVRLILASKYQSDLTERYRQAIEDYRGKWTGTEQEQLKEMFQEIHQIAARHTKTSQLTTWAYLDEYIILALQCVAIEKRFVENWISP